MENIAADKYGWQTGEHEASHEYLVPAVFEALEGVSGKHLLDIGVGNGALLPVWHKAGYQVAAFEPDLDGFNFSSRHSFADLRHMGLGEPMPADWHGKFDVAICLEVVEHLFNAHVLPEALKEVLKPEGIAVISTPYHGYLKNLALAVFNKWDFHHHPVRVGGHVKFWSKATLIKLFEQHGFELVRFKGAGRLPYLWKSMVLTFRFKQIP